MTGHPAFLLLEDGTLFNGTSPGRAEPAFGEVVFTTNLSGYQETFTDPS
ncbi:MAG: carbamoyl-phosphate synthase domain-containing protein, partial [Gemmatimonadales bacterium]